MHGWIELNVEVAPYKGVEKLYNSKEMEKYM
jgi:hypothetical protein